MSDIAINTAHAVEEEHHDEGRVKVYGFLVYILQDLLLFATLFATFLVFAGSYDAGPFPKQLINLPFVMVETFLLLFSSITYGFAMVQVHRSNLAGVRLWLAITFLLGLGFICMELYEFSELIHEGAVWTASAYWSSFYALVSTHGIHVTFGLIWMVCMFAHLNRKGLNAHNRTRLACLSIFWHFLDIVWVGVFTVVYLMGAMS